MKIGNEHASVEFSRCIDETEEIEEQKSEETVDPDDENTIFEVSMKLTVQRK